MKKLFRLAALALAVFMLTGIFAACGKDVPKQVANWVIVSFDLNYNEALATDQPAFITVTTGEAYGKLPSNPSREGYIFKGWYLNKDGTGSEVTEETVVAKNANNHTLYAKWEEDGTQTPGETPILQIAVIAKGYGGDYADELARAFQRKTGIKSKVVNSTPDESFVANSLMLGPSVNDIDVYFALNGAIIPQLMDSAWGGGPAWADLSDVYDTPAAGYNESGAGVTYGKLMDPYFLQAMTYPSGNGLNSDYAGKRFAVPWSSGISGFIYNNTLWETTNAKLPAGQKLKLPKTTDEMFTLFEKIKAIPSNDRGGAYAFTYSGLSNYLDMAFAHWWPQYDGLKQAGSFFQGKLTAGGPYTADIYNTQGRLEAYKAVERMLRPSNCYANPADVATVFESQLNFLEGKAFFNLNGEWLEREMSGQFVPGEADVRYFRAPVISAIVNNPEISALFTGSVTQKDALLSQAVDYIDEYYINGNASAQKPAFLSGASSAQIDFLKDARLTQYCQARYIAAVPGYSNQISAAKEFLKFMLSKEGQEIVMETTCGAVKAPLSVNAAQFDYYKNEATAFYKSKIEIMKKWEPFSYGTNYPIVFLGGAAPFGGGNYGFTQSFAMSYGISAETYFSNEVNYYKGYWPSIMAVSGLA